MSAETVALTAQVSALLTVRERLRNALIAAGVDPEEVRLLACSDTWGPHVDHAWEPDAKPGAKPCTAHLWDDPTAACCTKTGPHVGHVFHGSPGDKCSEPTDHKGHR